jgi:hypothetical protein
MEAIQMLLDGLWHGGLRDQSVEDMANANLPVMRLLGLDLEADEPNYSVLPLQDTPDGGPKPGMACWNQLTSRFRHSM